MTHTQLLLRHPRLLPFFLLCLAIGTLPSVGGILLFGSALLFKIFIIVCIVDAFKKTAYRKPFGLYVATVFLATIVSLSITYLIR
jgi:uncharacterized membrane protein